MKLRHIVFPALLAGAVACDGLFEPDRVPTTLAVLAGDAQTDTIDAALDTLMVEVRDQEGATMRNVRIEWLVESGEAVVTPVAERTDAAGVAAAAVTLGTRAGEVVVAASANSRVAARFQLTALPGRPAAIEAPDSVLFTALADTFRIAPRVVDRHGNEIGEPALEMTLADGSVALLENGLLRSEGPGRTTLTLRSGGVSVAVPVVVAQVPQRITLSASSAAFDALGDTVRVTAGAYDANDYAITTEPFIWTSSAPDVAAVDSTGLVTSRGPGEAEVTVTVAGGSASFPVSVVQAAARVEVEPAEVMLPALADTTELSATAYDANDYPIEGATFTWTSTDTTVAAVVSPGVVVSRGPGMVDVRAEHEGVAAAAEVVVDQEPDSVAVAPGSVEFTAIGDTEMLSAEVFDRNGFAIEGVTFAWSSGNTKVATVSDAGVVTSRGPGETRLAAAIGGVEGTAEVVVDIVITSLEVSPGNFTIDAIEGTRQLSATAYDANGNAIPDVAVEWSSEAADVISVDADGLATGHETGSATIMATLEDLTARSEGTVDQAVARVDLAAPGDTLREAGETLQLVAKAYDSNDFEVEGQTFSWWSSRTSVAKVNSSGLLTAGSSEGTATIEASADGASDRVEVVRQNYGVLVLTFDDAYEDVYTLVFPLLKQHGIKANIALPTGFVGRKVHDHQRLSETQIEALHEAGWSIVPHTIDHSDLTTLSSTEVDRQLRESKQWVEDRGYRGSNVFIVPFHRWGNDERQAIEGYFDAARGYDTLHDSHGGMVDWPPSDPYALTSIDAVQFYRTAEGRAEMEETWVAAIQNGKFVGTYFHRIEDDYDDFKAAIELLAKYKEHIRTYAELF